MAETYYVKPENSPVNDVTLNAGDAMFIANGGTANGAVVNSDGSATVNDGGSANNTTVNEGGTLHLIGGAATGVNVASNGRLEVNKGATATGIEAEKGATLVFDVAADTHIAGTSDGAAFQIQNGVATGFTLETGVLIVSDGGKAVETVLNSAGFINVSQGGSADKAVINTSGELKVSSGGTATEATVKTGGKLTVESSGFCDDATVEMGGNLYVISSGGTAAGTYIGAMGNLAVSKGGTAYGTTVGAGGFLTVGTKGIAEGADVNGFLNVLEGGLASNVTVNEGAVVYIQSKGTGSDVYVDDGGILEAMADGRLKGATVAQGGSATIHADVMASNVVIDGGKVTVMSDGWAAQTGVSGNTIVENGGLLEVEGGAHVEGAYVSAGGHVDVLSDGSFASALITNADVSAYKGAFVSRMNLEQGGVLRIESGASAQHLNVSEGGVLTGVLREASEIRFYGGTVDLDISTAAPGNEFLIDDYSFSNFVTTEVYTYLCTLTVSDTQAEGAYKLIEGASGFDTSKAITVKDTSGTTLGTLTVNGGSTTIGGVNYTLAVTTEDVLTVTIAGGVDLTGDLNSDFELNAGMVGSSVNILEGGRLIVDGGGSADVVTVNFGGLLYVYNGGKATQIKENGGYVGVNDGADVTFVSNSFGGYVYDSPDEWATIHSGTTGTDLTVGNDGLIYVYSGGTAVDTTVAADGNLGVDDGGKLTGKVTIETGAIISVCDGAIVDFDLTKTTTADPALVNNLSFFGTAAVNYTLTVDGTEADGDYKLAEGATGFDKTITVKDTLGTELGTLTVAGGTTDIGGVNYTLTLTGDLLGVTLAAGGGTPVDLTGDLDYATNLTTGMYGSSVNILNGGNLNILNGGLASQTTVNSGGYLAVEEGGSANVVTVNPNGVVFIKDGGSATEIHWTPCEGDVTVWDGGYATFASSYSGVYYGEGGHLLSSAAVMDGKSLVENCRMFVMNNGTATNTDIKNWGLLQIWSGGTAIDTTGVNGFVYVSSGGMAVSTTVGDNCFLQIYSGGVAADATVNAGGTLVVNAGGKVTGKITLETGAVVSAYSYGAILDFDLTATSPGADALVNDLSPFMAASKFVYTLTVSGTEADGNYKLAEGAAGFDETITVVDTLGATLGTLTVAGGKTTIGGRSYTLTLSTGGLLGLTLAAGVTPDITGDLDSEAHLKAGKYGSDVNILSGGKLYVSNGALASQTTLNYGGKLYVEEAGAVVSQTTITSGGKLYVSEGGVATDVTANSGGSGFIYSGGTATGIVAADGAYFYIQVAPNTYAQGTYAGNPFEITDTVADYTIQSCSLSVENGGTANNVTVEYGLSVKNGGKATGVTVASGGVLTVSSGGTATGIVAADGAKLYFTVAPNTYAQGKYAGTEFEITDTVTGYAIHSGGVLTVDKGGTADALTVNYACNLSVADGGTVTNVTENGGYVFVEDGADVKFVAHEFTGVEVKDYNYATVHSGTTATETTVGNDGYLLVYSGGIAKNTTLSDFGQLYVYEGGLAKNTTLNADGILLVLEGGVANGVTVANGGQLSAYGGGKVTGKITFETGAIVAANTGAILDFDLTQTTAGAEALVNDLSFALAQPFTYTLTVDGTQSSGTYNLGGNATGFNKIISVKNTSGVDYGYLTFGGTLSTAFANFTLNLTSDDTLTVNVAAKGGSDITPPTITITPSTTELAKSVVMTAEFTDNVAVATQQYRIGDGAWLNYEAPFTVTENAVIGFRATDTSGNTTVESYEVQNIQPDAKNEPDNGWNDYLYDKKKGWNKDENISQFASNTITGNGEIHLDPSGLIDLEDMHNMFGNDGINVDSGDVGKIAVTTAAKLSFSIKSTADGTFYIYQDGFDKKGNRKQITVGKVTVKKGKVATLSGICLATDGQYYAAMTAKNVKKPGPSAIYNVTVVDSTIFVDADDGWNNAALNKVVVDNPFTVERGVKTVKLDNADMIDGGDFNNFVGFSDPVDFAKLKLASTASLSFDIGTNGSAKFTLWKRDTGTGKLTKVGGVTSLKSKKGELVTKSTKAQLLEVGDKYDYFISMECADAAKGGSAYYNVNVNTVSTRFFDSNDGGENNWLFDKKNKAYNDDANLRSNTLSAYGSKDLDLDNTASGDPAFNNFVGFKDSADYAKVVLTKGGSLSFKITALADVTFEIWQKGEDKKGNPALNSLQKKTDVKVKDYAVGASATTDALTLEAGEYYISVTAKSTKANEKGSAFYNVTALFGSSEADALVMPEISDALAMTDSLSFGQYGSDAIADVSAASNLADLNADSGWQNLASLA